MDFLLDFPSMNPENPLTYMMNFTHRNIKSILILCLVLFFGSCKEDPARHLNLGNWYLNKGLIDEAIVEYREVARTYSGNESELTRDEFAILGKAHFKLAIAYTKKGWWEYALSEAKTSFEVQPNKDSHDLVQLIEQKLDLRVDS
jgi:tetratricopeptide (TPR) repeat protein